MPKTSGADLQQPSTFTFLSLTSGKRHRAHSLGIRPICHNTNQLKHNKPRFTLISHLSHSSQITIFLQITSPDSLVENLTISEQAAAGCRPLAKTFPNEGELELLLSGNVNTTSSPGFTLLPLHVDSPETSPQPTNHHSLPTELSRRLTSSTKPSPESQAQSLAFASSPKERKIWFSPPFRFELVTAVLGSGAELRRGALGALDTAGNSLDLKFGMSKIMLIAAVASFLAMCRALIMSMSEYSEPTTDRTVDNNSFVTLFPI
jgi:hypothetical protein